MTEKAASTLEGLLSKFAAFRELDPERLRWLAERARPFHCTVGQELLRPDRMPEFCFGIVEGRGRLLHDDPGLRRPVTLAYAHPGDLVGWAGLLRRSPCEWLTAATPLKLIGFAADDFRLLASEEDSFRTWLSQASSPAELMDAFQPALRNRPVAEPAEREVMRQLVPGARIIEASQLRSLPDDGAIWLWNSQLDQGEPVSIGDPVDQVRLAQIPIGEPLRLIRVESALWKNLLDPDLEAPKQSQRPDAMPSAGDRYADLLPPPQGEQVLPEILSTSNNRSKQRQVVPTVTGVGPLGQTMACLEMLARHHNVPFRRDVIERAAKDNLANRKATSLELLGNLSTAMGFTGTLVHLPEAKLARVPFPCIAWIEDQPSVIFGITEGVVQAVLPEYGRVQFPLNHWLDGQEGVRLLLLQRGREAHNRKLGFSWFMPQIRKYRRSLIEVLIASLVLQLLNLAQPLVLQQIFDKVIGQQNLDTLYTDIN